ncbi:thiamine pyrophosphate-dependent enzyme [Paracoccus seriniphilus]|nr:thiamine pyrophosphate-dependent enzyme [Paracoccus seriniphilus]
MSLIRTFEDRLHVEFQTGDIPGFIHLYAGQEACAVGCTAHFKKQGRLRSSNRR